jgi:hypothetical protein
MIPRVWAKEKVPIVRKEGTVEIRSYNAEMLVGELGRYEQLFGVCSEDLVRLYRADDLPPEIPAFDAFVWADLYREAHRMADADDCALTASPQAGLLLAG